LTARASLYNFDDDNGARWAVYDDGMEIPPAVKYKLVSLMDRHDLEYPYASRIASLHPNIQD
jgi:hypothetical protein